MNKSLITCLTIAILSGVALFADPVSLQVDNTTGKVLSPLIADSTSNKTIAVFRIPMAGGIPMMDFTDSVPTISTQLARDFELKIYRQSMPANTSSVAEIDKVFWYHSPNSDLVDQVLPLGVPPGYFSGGESGGSMDAQNKTLFKIRHGTYPSLSAHRGVGFVFTAAVIYVETAGTSYELLKDCHAMFCRYSATDSEALGDTVEGRAWHPILPEQWVSELPMFLQ